MQLEESKSFLNNLIKKVVFTQSCLWQWLAFAITTLINKQTNSPTEYIKCYFIVCSFQLGVIEELGYAVVWLQLLP